MCGIVAVFNKNQQEVDSFVLKRMADRINYRGPDDEGQMIEAAVGFYHKRLSIIDLVSGRQPMTKDGVTIIFNGEIYNYIELRNSLKQIGHTFETTSDTEVILSVYQQYGPSFLNELNGMYSFLIFDRNRNCVLAARDHFGIKPLYYYNSEKHLLFASEIKALLEHPDVEAEPDYDSIQEYLTFQFVLADATLFKGIRRVLPGYYHLVDLASFKSQVVKYWEPSFIVDTHHTEEYFIYQLRNLLEHTVSIQMRSDVPVGTYLSGGLDSSVVTLLAAPKAERRLKTFTGAFREGLDFDETRYARDVARSCGAEGFDVYPSEREFVELLPSLVYHMDEPVAGPGLFPQYIVSRLASKEVKVVLGGQGGDEIFGGYARYVVAYLEQALKGAIFENNEEGEHIVSLRSILPNLPHLQKYTPMMRHFWEGGAFEPMDRRYFRLIDRSGGDLSLLNDDFRMIFDREKVFGHFQTIFNHPDTHSYYNKMVHFDMFSSLPALLHVEDRMSMAVSLESRVPLLDRRIVDLITSMPPGMKFKGAEMKYIFKRAIKDILPPSIFNRKDKMGFPVPLHLWAKNGVKDFFRDILFSSTCRNRGIFDPKQVEKLIENENSFGRRLWGIINLELWFRQFIDAAH